MDNKCNGCAAAVNCPTACEPGSIMCMVKRLQSGQAKADQQRKMNNTRFCQSGGQEDEDRAD